MNDICANISEFLEFSFCRALPTSIFSTVKTIYTHYFPSQISGDCVFDGTPQSAQRVADLFLQHQVTFSSALSVDTKNQLRLSLLENVKNHLAYRCDQIRTKAGLLGIQMPNFALSFTPKKSSPYLYAIGDQTSFGPSVVEAIPTIHFRINSQEDENLPVETEEIQKIRSFSIVHALTAIKNNHSFNRTALEVTMTVCNLLFWGYGMYYTPSSIENRVIPSFMRAFLYQIPLSLVYFAECRLQTRRSDIQAMDLLHSNEEALTYIRSQDAPKGCRFPPIEEREQMMIEWFQERV